MTSNPMDGWVLERQDPTWDISSALLLFPCSVLRPDVVPPALPPPATLNVGERAWMKLAELQQQAKPFFWGGVLSVSFTAEGYWQAKGGLQCLSYGATKPGKYVSGRELLLLEVKYLWYFTHVSRQLENKLRKIMSFVTRLKKRSKPERPLTSATEIKRNI